MLKWILLFLLLLIVLILLFFRLGLEYCWEEGGGWLKLYFGPLTKQLWPVETAKPARKKPRKPKKKKAAAAKPAEKTSRWEKFRNMDKTAVLELFQEFIPLLSDIFSKFQKQIRIDSLEFSLVWGEDDPADAAIHYGKIVAALEGLQTIWNAMFIIKKQRIAYDLDFDLPNPRLYFRTKLSLRPMRLCFSFIPTIVQLLKILRKPQNAKGAKTNGEPEPSRQ